MTTPADVGATDINSGGSVTSAADNPSNGLGAGDLFSQLLDNATTAYVANQQSNAAIAQAPSFARNPLAFITSTGGGRQWLIIGAGLLALALILRR